MIFISPQIKSTTQAIILSSEDGLDVKMAPISTMNNVKIAPPNAKPVLPLQYALLATIQSYSQKEIALIARSLSYVVKYAV